jgi:hypothetical protein
MYDDEIEDELNEDAQTKLEEKMQRLPEEQHTFFTEINSLIPIKTLSPDETDNNLVTLAESRRLKPPQTLTVYSFIL